MEQISTWEAILAGMGGGLVLFWLGPGIKGAVKQSQDAENKAWKSLLLPLVAVILFVILLITLA